MNDEQEKGMKNEIYTLFYYHSNRTNFINEKKESLLHFLKINYLFEFNLLREKVNMRTYTFCYSISSLNNNCFCLILY